MPAPSAAAPVPPAPPSRRDPDVLFWAGLGVIGLLYLFLIVAMLVADALYMAQAGGEAGSRFWEGLAGPDIQYAIRLSLLSCALTTILSVWVAVPVGYFLSRLDFPGRAWVDAALDIPIVLPPLVIGLSLLILFQRIGATLAYALLPMLAGLAAVVFVRGFLGCGARNHPRELRIVLGSLLGGVALCAALLGLTPLGPWLSAGLQKFLSHHVTFEVPSVVLAQFAVACAFAVRTMRTTFDQINPRPEQVALTLGCTRSQAFWRVALPEAWRGVVTAGTLAWARALGEFGPILVFSGTTRRRTEVLPTTIYLELSVGNLESAVAVSLMMVVAAVLVLVVVRRYGVGTQFLR